MRSRHIFGMLLAGFVVAVGCSDSGDGDGDAGGAGTAASGGDSGDASSGGGSGGTSATGGAGATTGTGASGGVSGEAGGGAVAGGGGVAGGAATDGGGGGPCVQLKCQGLGPYKCGDCIDNDGDGKIDMEDPDCLGPCHNNEDSYYGGIPGQAGPGCTVDCYFDKDSGAGNDKCCWDHRCDPKSIAPLYPPEGPSSKCAYMGADKTATYKPSCAPNNQATCDSLFAKGGQDSVCSSYCGPLTPNGCDCFGCCELPAHSGKFVWLGSEDADGNGTCSKDTVGDVTKCQPCTPVDACYNECAECELCLGKTELPPQCFPTPDAGVGGAGGTGGTPGSGGSSGSCGGQICPVGSQPCGLSCQPPCPGGYFCNTGCCVPVPS
jgi:hypothetical protein